MLLPYASSRWSSWRRAALVAAVLWVSTAHAAPVSVRVPEGYAHGFVTFYAGDEAVGHGELIQFPRRRQMQNRLTISFDDGSLYDETVVFTQARVFRLRRYHLIELGPSFPEQTAVAFDADGHYTARTRKTGEDEKTAEGHTDVPPDVYNGMTSTLIKNLPAGVTGEVHQLAFTPKPHLLSAQLVPEGDDSFSVGTMQRSAARYRVVLHATGLAGVVAPLIGKDPPDVFFWIVPGEAPTFVRFLGPLSADGPVWRGELGSPRWLR